jgi:hypothetical protein
MTFGTFRVEDNFHTTSFGLVEKHFLANWANNTQTGTF